MLSRTARCPCGSGRRYKECHGRISPGADRAPDAAPAVAGKADALALRTLLERALAHQTARRLPDAEALYRTVLAREPAQFDALHMLGVVRHQIGDHDEAVELLRRAIDIYPAHAPAHSNLALALTAKRAYTEALASVDRALALSPHDVEALNNRGTVLQAQLRHAEALQCFDAALAHAPDHAEILSNRANTLLELRRHEEAAQCFARLVAVAPEYPWALGYLYQTRMLCCDWAGIGALTERIHTSVRAGRRAIGPFAYLALSDCPADQLICARIVAADHAHPPLPSPPGGLRYGHARIRIAYVSANFREHPSSYAEARLFETHDRKRFEVTAISFGPDADDPLRRRLERAFDHFVDVRGRTDREVAALIREREIDIAIDVMGYTQDSRFGIFAFRGAPVQALYHGYPGTLGTDRMDYLLADARVIPDGEETQYTERIVRLPDTYFAHDPTRKVGDPPRRVDAGLPEGAFVFCCFNNNYKIMPATFDRWMRILKRVENSVLWLLAPDAVAQRNLRDEAARRGIDPTRLVFAVRVGMEAHLGRHGLADLSLDTHHYNAHTTAIDALWAGLPVLTYPGSTLASRGAASILHAIGLPELIARDPADCEDRAVALARAPSTLLDIKARLARHRASHPLFDLARYRNAIEAAYVTMWARNEAGLPPAAFDVAPGGAVEVRE